MKTEYPANRFQVRLYARDGSGDSVCVAHSLTLSEARDEKRFPYEIIKRNGRDWTYSYCLNDEYLRDMVRK